MKAVSFNYVIVITCIFFSTNLINAQSNNDFYFEKAKEYSSDRNYQKALISIDKYLTTNPESLEGLSLKINMLNMLKRYEDALSAFKLIENRSDIRSEVYASVGVSYQNLERYYEAINYYSKSIALTNFHIAYYNRGECKFQLGDKKGGCKDFLLADEHGYQHAWFMNKDECQPYIDGEVLAALLQHKRDYLLETLDEEKKSKEPWSIDILDMLLLQDLTKITEEQLKDRDVKLLYEEIYMIISRAYSDKVKTIEDSGEIYKLMKYYEKAIEYALKGNAPKDELSKLYHSAAVYLISTADPLELKCNYISESMKLGNYKLYEYYQTVCNN